MTPPAELGLSPGLCRDIQLWQGWFDGVFHHCPDGERYAALGHRFDEAGKRLAERVARELGAGWQVWYEPQGGWRLEEPGPAKALRVVGDEATPPG